MCTKGSPASKVAVYLSADTALKTRFCLLTLLVLLNNMIPGERSGGFLERVWLRVACHRHRGLFVISLLFHLSRLAGGSPAAMVVSWMGCAVTGVSSAASQTGCQLVTKLQFWESEDRNADNQLCPALAISRGRVPFLAPPGPVEGKVAL